jgi:hypothetical protein
MQGKMVVKRLLTHPILYIGLMAFFITTKGAQWVQTNGPYGGHILSLTMSSNALFAGTDLNGVWRRSISEILESMNAYRQVGIVNQSYFKIGPLSHNGSLFAIEFGISSSDQVTIAMYNLAGRKMPESINQHLNAGSYFCSRKEKIFI